MGIIVRPLSDALGAEIAGVDLRLDLDGDTFSRIADAWRKHLVLLFRDQRLSTEEQIAFASLFGELQEVRTAPGVSHANPYVMMVSNVDGEDWKGVLPDGEMQLHADQCYYEHPCKLTMLYALEVPPAGGDTMFVNCYSAYDSLTNEIKSEIAGLRALNVYDYDANATIRENVISPDAPRFAHPVVTTHPETGRKALYVNRLMTDHIVGLDREKSRALLDRLIETVERPDFICRHVWQVGDVVMWDNRCTLHGRTGFDPSHRRMLRRVTVKGERPSR
jgi:taurine dioxygenase